MLTGPKELCAELLKNALARYLVIDRNEISTKLLSEDDGHLSFSNVKLVPQKIKLNTTKDCNIIYVLLEGEISKLTISWKWSSFLILEDAGINFEGLNLSGRILVEDSVASDISDQNGDATSNDEIFSNRQKLRSRRDNSKQQPTKNSVFEAFRREYDSFMDSLQDFIPTSTMLQRIFYHITNILSVTMSDMEFVLNFLEDERKLGKPPFQLIFGMKLFEFLPLAPGSTNGKRRFSTVETHRLVHVGIKAFFMDIAVPEETERVLQWNRLPVFEPPFTYAAMIRRIYGVRFVDSFYGFEVLGVPTENDKASIRHDDTHGITVNLRGKQMQTINDVQDLLFGESAETAADTANTEGVPAKSTRNFGDDTTDRVLTTTFSKILRCATYFVMALSTFIIYKKIRTIAIYDIFELAGFAEGTSQNERWAQRLSMLCHLAVVATFTTLIAYSRKFVSLLNKPMGQAWLQGTDKDELYKHPAIIHLPMAFLKIYIPGDLRIDLSKVALVGRLDFSVLNLSAASALIASSVVTSVKRLRVEGDALRMLINDKGVLLNWDVIHTLYVPEKLRITEPLEGTVLRLQNDILRIKFKSIVGVKLNVERTRPRFDPQRKRRKRKKKKKIKLKMGSAKTSMRSTPSRQTSSDGESDTHQQMSGSLHPRRYDRKEFIRERIQYDYETEVKNFRHMATEFEKIPVKTHVHNLRLYKDSFRGSQAVDWILDEMDFVKTRQAAVELARQMQTDFNLFQDVTRDFATFHDDPELLYRFVPPKNRRCWVKKHAKDVSDRFYQANEFLKDERAFPFQIVATVKDILLNDEKDDWLATLQGGFLYVKPCPYVGAFDTVLSFDYVGTEVFLAGNARIHGYLHPELPHEIHHLQFSVDFLRATKGYSAENWLRSLGFEATDEIAQDDDEDDEADGGYALPYVYVAPFSLNLVLKGVVAMNDTQGRWIRVDEFFGTEKTTSNNLIVYFITVVLARTPGLIGDVNVLGMNVTEVAGVGTGMTIGATLIPGGHYIALAFIAGADMVRGAIAAGKESRGRPDDRFRPGDIARGIAYMTTETNRKGAVRRGKSYHDFYNDEDRVNFDPADFAVGAAEETGKYLDHNKAKFVGVTVGCMTTVALGVVLTPWVGLGAGVLLGQGTTMLMNFTERKIKEHKDQKMLEKGTGNFTQLQKSILLHERQTKEAQKQRWKRISIFPPKKQD